MGNRVYVIRVSVIFLLVAFVAAGCGKERSGSTEVSDGAETGDDVDTSNDGPSDEDSILGGGTSGLSQGLNDAAGSLTTAQAQQLATTTTTTTAPLSQAAQALLTALVGNGTLAEATSAVNGWESALRNLAPLASLLRTLGFPNLASLINRIMVSRPAYQMKSNATGYHYVERSLLNVVKAILDDSATKGRVAFVYQLTKSNGATRVLTFCKNASTGNRFVSNREDCEGQTKEPGTTTYVYPTRGTGRFAIYRLYWARASTTSYKVGDYMTTRSAKDAFALRRAGWTLKVLGYSY